MARGISIHIGVNAVDPAHYGSSFPLYGCEADAAAWMRLAGSLGYLSRALLTGSARSHYVFEALDQAARDLHSGDILLLTYSGHGSQVKDEAGNEHDGLNETWCLFDRMVTDDELSAKFAQFKTGVRLVLVSDSCHSGTVARSPLDMTGSPRFIPAATAQSIVDGHRMSYAVPRDIYKNPGLMDVSGIAFMACKDNQVAQEISGMGAWSRSLLTDAGKGLTYRQLYEVAQANVARPQEPILDIFGAGDISEQTAFAI